MDGQQGHDEPQIPDVPEQDQGGTGDLPTYDDLTEQHANEPNSRFGRWRSWITKRAGERYADTSTEEWERRRARGWDLEPPMVVEQPPTPIALTSGYADTSALQPTLRLNTQLQDGPPALPPKDWTPTSLRSTDNSFTTLPSYSNEQGGPVLPTKVLTPSHLLLNHFGSRFIPHTRSPIRCLLPLPNERLLLIGTDDGLSVLNLFPSEWTEHGLTQKGPHDAHSRVIWTGEGVLQLSLLEVQSAGEHGVSGVVLALVGGDPLSPKDVETGRAIRLYNLSSLVSLAKWATSDRMTNPLDLRRPTGWQPQETPKKKHARGSSIAKGLKSLVLESPIGERASMSFHSRITPPINTAVNPAASPPRPKASPSASSSGSNGLLRPEREDSTESTTSWDVVDDLPLRWATDYVPLASPGSKLGASSVQSYELRLSEDPRVRGGAFLAIATKTAILLYETRKGERAFHFVKEFYTPLTPRGLAFVQQAVQNSPAMFAIDVHTSHRVSHHSRSSSDPIAATLSYPPQLSIFVRFEKKAGIIRIADSAVGELELYAASDASTSSTPSREYGHRLGPSMSTSSSGTFGQRGRAASIGNLRKDKPGTWLHPIQVNIPPPPGAMDYTLPTPGSPGSMPVYLLSRGKTTHVLPYPLPANLSSVPPLRVLTWSNAPNHVAVRINHTSYEQGSTPFIQLVAFTDDGVEVQEVDLDVMIGRNSFKGKGRAVEAVYADADIGGETTFLCLGGHWQRAPVPQLARGFSVSSDATGTSFESLDAEHAEAKLAMEQGIYAAVCKGVEDYRVFWVGGTGKEDIEDNDEA